MQQLKKSQQEIAKNINELNFLQQNQGFCQNLSPSVATTACW